MIELGKTGILFALTAVAEIVGCYLPLLVLKQGRFEIRWNSVTRDGLDWLSARRRQ